MAVASTSLVVSKTSDTPYQLDPEQTSKASKALLGHVKAETRKASQSADKKNLLATHDSDSEDDGAQDNDQPIWLNLSTKQHIVDKNQLKPSKIAVPHSLNTSEDINICLITTDPQRAVKNVVADSTFPTSLSTRINRIIGISKLQARYKTFEGRRQLLSEHDVFLADDRIVTRLPALLGKVFYKGTSKRPIPISISPRKSGDAKSLKTKKTKEEKEASVAGPNVVAAEIERALNSVTVSLRPGTNVSVRVGLASFTPQQLAENVAVVVPRLIEKHVAKGWRNVRSVNIKSPTSFAVPIWLSKDLWAAEENVIEGGGEQQGTIEDGTEDKKRKRNPATTKGPQSGQRKKAKVGGGGGEKDTRKQRLTEQKAKAYDAL